MSEKKIAGMATCTVCGRDFPLMVEDHYIARDTEKSGLVPAIAGKQEPELFDAFDCPHCGSQYIAQERKRVCPCDFGICDECEYAGETEDDEEEEN